MNNAFSLIFSAIRKRIMRMRDKGKDPRLAVSIPDDIKKILHAADLSLLDIGGRSGPLDEFALFAPFTHLFVCEPDREEADRVKQVLTTQRQWRDVSVITEAIDPHQSEVTLYMTREPGLSSLLEPDAAIVSQFYHANGHKYTRRDWDVVGNRHVSAITLDHAAQKYGISNLSVLKIDTQGTELGILQSGLVHVLPSVVAVYVEAEFLPFYRGQHMFGDVHIFLQNQGFRLVDMKRSLLRRSIKYNPVYSKRELAWTHSLYFRDRNADGTALGAEQKYRLACTAFLSEYFDYAAYLFADASVQAHMLLVTRDPAAWATGSRVAEDIRIYADNFWRMLAARTHSFEEKNYIADVWHDRGNER